MFEFRKLKTDSSNSSLTFYIFSNIFCWHNFVDVVCYLLVTNNIYNKLHQHFQVQSVKKKLWNGFRFWKRILSLAFLLKLPPIRPPNCQTFIVYFQFLVLVYFFQTNHGQTESKPCVNQVTWNQRKKKTVR